MSGYARKSLGMDAHQRGGVMRPLVQNGPTLLPFPDFCIAWESANDAAAQFPGWPILPEFLAEFPSFLAGRHGGGATKIPRPPLMHLMHLLPRIPHCPYRPWMVLSNGLRVRGGSRVEDPLPGECK
jgi:hypothetical protein